jgi:hypothetical protein
MTARAHDNANGARAPGQGPRASNTSDQERRVVDPVITERECWTPAVGEQERRTDGEWLSDSDERTGRV